MAPNAILVEKRNDLRLKPVGPYGLVGSCLEKDRNRLCACHGRHVEAPHHQDDRDRAWLFRFHHDGG